MTKRARRAAPKAVKAPAVVIEDTAEAAAETPVQKMQDLHCRLISLSGEIRDAGLSVMEDALAARADADAMESVASSYRDALETHVEELGQIKAHYDETGDFRIKQTLAVITAIAAQALSLTTVHDDYRPTRAPEPKEPETPPRDDTSSTDEAPGSDAAEAPEPAEEEFTEQNAQAARWLDEIESQITRGEQKPALVFQADDLEPVPASIRRDLAPVEEPLRKNVRTAPKPPPFLAGLFAAFGWIINTLRGRDPLPQETLAAEGAN